MSVGFELAVAEAKTSIVDKHVTLKPCTNL